MITWTTAAALALVGAVILAAAGAGWFAHAERRADHPGRAQGVSVFVGGFLGYNGAVIYFLVNRFPRAVHLEGLAVGALLLLAFGLFVGVVIGTLFGDRLAALFPPGLPADDD